MPGCWGRAPPVGQPSVSEAIEGPCVQPAEVPPDPPTDHTKARESSLQPEDHHRDILPGAHTEQAAPRCCCCAMKVNCVLILGIVLGVVGSTFLVAFGVLYVKPYMAVRSMERTHCMTVTEEPVEGYVMCASCSGTSASCLSKYPCVKIWTNLTTQAGHVLNNVTLYDSYETFILQRQASQCSYHKCTSSYAQNFEAVVHFSKEFGVVGYSYECYYEPSDLSFALLEVITRDTVIHCMFWPALAFLTGFIILLVYLNHPGQSNHGFNSLERPWAKQQSRYECIIDPKEGTMPVSDTSWQKFP